MVADEEPLRGLAEIAARHSLAIISDEVFGEFLFGRDAFPRIATTDAPLVFTLNGLSKMFALPGMKIGWMAVTGHPGLVRKSMAALDLISDTFLPVNEIGQFAVPSLQPRPGFSSPPQKMDLRVPVCCSGEPGGNFFRSAPGRLLSHDSNLA